VEENEEESKEKDGLDYEQVAPQQGLINVGLLTDVELTANHTIENGQDHISLKLTGQAVLTLGVLQSTYVIFQLPPEITNVVKEESLKATYDVPGLLGIGRRTGEFSKSDIKVDGNQIYINFKEILALSIGGRYEFTLDFDINTLPSSYEENYTFYGQTTSQIIDISLIDLNKLGKATISAPDGKLSFPNTGGYGRYFIYLIAILLFLLYFIMRYKKCKENKKLKYYKTKEVSKKRR